MIEKTLAAYLGQFYGVNVTGEVEFTETQNNTGIIVKHLERPITDDIKIEEDILIQKPNKVINKQNLIKMLKYSLTSLVNSEKYSQAAKYRDRIEFIKENFN